MKKKNKKWLFWAMIAVIIPILFGIIFTIKKQGIEINFEQIGNLILSFIFILFAILLVRNIASSNADGKKYKVVKSTNINFDQIAGMAEAKKEVQTYIDIMRNHKQYMEHGVRIPKGIILEGSPGNGKTLLAKAIATEMEVSFLQANAADIGGILVGKGSQDLKKIFRHARKNKPCIVFLDEIDAIGRKRVDSGSDANNDGNRTVTSLLTELDGFDDNEGIFVIAATNRIDSMDDALVRPGRFDRKITIKNPDYKTRLELIKMYTKNKALSSTINTNDLAWKFSGLSCADIENCINEAAIHAISRKSDVIDVSDFEQTIIQQRIRGYLLNDEEHIYQRELTAFHEAGHAVMTYDLTDDIVDIISIVPTTSNVKGFTMSYGIEDRNLLSLKEIENRIIILMAGRAAEYLYLNEDENLVTTGCSDDMARAVELMKLYIKTSTKGLSYNQNDNRMMSETFQEELRNLTAAMWERTVACCKDHWSSIHILAEELTEKKWVTKNEIITLLTPEESSEKGA